MINKLIVPYLTCFVASFGSLFFSVAIAQENSSPYSAYGLGEKGGLENAAISGLGNNKVNFISPSILNISNPASYSYIKNQYPIFSIGVSSRFSTFESNGATQKNATTGLSELAMGFSFAKRFGLSFGLKPYSKRGYSFSEKFALGSDSVQYDYLGSGDISRAFAGFSGHILNFDKLQWTVGVNFSSLFGTLNNERRAYLLGSTSAVGGVSYKTTRIKSFHYEFGTVLKKQFLNGHSLTVAGTIEPLQQLTAYENKQLFSSSTDVTEPSTYSLVQETGEVKGKITIAPSYTFGFDYSIQLKDNAKNNRVRNSEIKILGSFNSTNWASYQSKFRDSVSTQGYPNTTEINVGIQYRPETDLLGKSITPKFFERMSYRIGFYSKTLPYTFNNTQLSEFGTSFGLGLPILTEKTESSLQFGFTYGKRGTKEVGSFNESFVGVNIGIIITPSTADRWFIKRKLD